MSFSARIYIKKVILLSVLLLWLSSAATVFAASTERVSVSTSSAEGNFPSAESSISSDARYVVFSSLSSTFVAGDTNAATDIFVRDRNTNITERVSVSSVGAEGNGNSSDPFVSEDGRYVVFASLATNLVAGDTNAASDIFVYDRDTDVIERVSVDDLGNEGDAGSLFPDISYDGRYIAFSSIATNLVAGDTNASFDIFVYDRDTNLIEIVSVDDLGNEGDANSLYPDMSSDGRYIVFVSDATNLVAGDTNAARDIFVYDRDTNLIERISVDDLGNEANAASGSSGNHSVTLSDSGRYVSFESDATNLVAGDTNAVTDIFIYDRDTDVIERVSVDYLGNEGLSSSYNPTASSNGRYVTFHTYSTLVSNDTNGAGDIFIRDRQMGTTQRVSLTSAGNQSSGTAYGSSISDDGIYVVFNSDGFDMVSGDTNNEVDVFIRTLNSTPTDISLSPSSVTENENSGTNIGNFTATDADAGDTHTFSLACTTPGADDGSFTISGDLLVSEETFDFETKSSYLICIRVTDSQGGTYDENLTITVNDVPESSAGGSARGFRNIRKPQSPPSVILDDSSIGISKNCYTFTSYMVKGSRGGEVPLLQTSLNVIGFNTGIIDGIFGPITNSGVKLFQKFNNLVPDGIVGPLTRSVLNSGC